MFEDGPQLGEGDPGGLGRGGASTDPGAVTFVVA